MKLLRIYVFIAFILLSVVFAVFQWKNKTLNTSIRAFQSRMNATDKLVILIDAPTEDEAERVIKELTKRLNEIPKNLLTRVKYEEADEIRFFKRRMPLYLEVSELQNVLTYIRKSIQFEKNLYNPVNVFTGVKLEKPKIDLDSMLERYLSNRPYKALPRGQYANVTGTKRAVLVYSSGKPFDSSSLNRLKNEVEHCIDGLSKNLFSRDVKIWIADPDNVENKEILHTIFRYHLSPFVILTQSSELATALAAKLRVEKNQSDESLYTVYSLSDFVPGQQSEKIKVLKQIRQTLKPQVLRNLSDGERRFAEKFLTLEVFHSFDESQLPQEILEKFTENNGSKGRVVYIHPNLELDNKTILERLNILASTVAPGSFIAQLPIYPDKQ